MRTRPLPLIALLAACGSAEPQAAAAPDSAAPPSRLEATVNAARTAEQRVEAAQAQAQARLDSQMQAVTEPAAP